MDRKVLIIRKEDIVDFKSARNSRHKPLHGPRQHVKKQRHHFANKVPYSQAMVYPVVRYRCESWTTKKAER